MEEEAQATDALIYVLKFTPDWVTPIPLSERWLVKLGWVKNGDSAPGIGDFHWFEYGDYETVNVGPGIFGIKEIGKEDTIANVRYVHELQNLYFKLAAKELI